MHRKGNENLFKDQSFYVGIDVHKKNWKVTILGEQYEHKSMNQNPNAKLLANYLIRNFPGGTYHAVYEAGFSGFKSCRELNKLGVNCIVINPADVPTTNKEKLQKTDKIDSRKLARSLRSKELDAIHIPDINLEADRALVRQQFRIVKDLSRIKNRIKSLLFQFGVDIPERFNKQSRYWSKNYLNWLKELSFEEVNIKQTLANYIRIGEFLRSESKILNKQLRELSQIEAYKSNFLLLLSIPGVGLKTAISFLCQIGNIRRFSNLNELCNYIGLVPSMYGSGDKMVSGKMIKRGRKEIKIMLIEASWRAIRIDPALMAKFNELSLKMNKNKAIIRIARKLLNRMRYVLINKQEYTLSVVK